MSDLMNCGHPVECLSEMLPDFFGDTSVTQRIGTVHCRWCADVARAEAKVKKLEEAVRAARKQEESYVGCAGWCDATLLILERVLHGEERPLDVSESGGGQNPPLERGGER